MTMFENNSSHSKDLSSLDEWLSYLETIHFTEIDLGLTRISQVAKRLNICFDFATVITVAGTNGKGTSCAFLENALLDKANINQLTDSEKNLKSSGVAVYSSPHIKRFNERLRVNQEDVSDELFIQAFKQVEQARQEISLSYYEYTTLAAFLILMQLKPRVIILEVGLGGRLDATNIIDADVSVLTTIDLDHQAFLGDTREKIGFEKAGIMRAEQIIVVGDIDAPKSVIAHANSLASHDGVDNALLSVRNKDFYITEQAGGFWSWHYQSRVLTDLVRPHIPRDNVATALMVLTKLGVELSTTSVNAIIEATKVAGRTELISPGDIKHYQLQCDVMLDVGHNPQAARYLAQQLAKLKEQGRYVNVHAVIAMLVDKDIESSLNALKSEVEHWYIGQLSVPRASTAEQAASSLRASGDAVNCFDNVTEAFKIANENANSNDLILVCGSFFTVAEIRELLLQS
ncbi:bifunctional tetrahydrofolate synthase/dihydrofolate synthase [Litorilituus sediminis]|nr:bifunctional tetrahydrofolate synthase/dihydrofolate synthase [Litorilituus sediminis]